LSFLGTPNFSLHVTPHTFTLSESYSQWGMLEEFLGKSEQKATDEDHNYNFEIC
jgi:hypothetical protein